MERPKEVNRLEQGATDERQPSGFSASDLVRAATLEILDAQACRALLIELLHSGGPACPACGKAVPPRQDAAFLAWSRVTCPGCGRTHSATTGTILAGSNLDPRQVVLIALGLDLGLATAHVARLVGVSSETVRLWRARLMPEQA